MKILVVAAILLCSEFSFKGMSLNGGLYSYDHITCLLVMVYRDCMLLAKLTNSFNATDTT